MSKSNRLSRDNNYVRRPVRVNLDELAVQGSRVQRRCAVRELKRLNKKSGGTHGD